MNSPRIFAKLNGVATSGNYDYIIAGGGMAGLSLAFYLNASEILRDRKILILDRDAKQSNDHTWCFWEKGAGAFEEIVFHRWKKLWFHGANEFSKLLDTGEYEYKMIRAIDFYQFVFDKIKKNPNIEFRRADIRAVRNETIETDAGNFAAGEFIFDSASRTKYDDSKYRNLWQHFLGWTIDTEREVFDERDMTLFDFRVAQKKECRFVYILPLSKTKALIEFTIFSDNILTNDEYATELKKYLRDCLKIENYRVAETERGIIPMSDQPHEEFSAGKIVRIGTAGGYVKPSTGYSFERTQRRLQELVRSVERGTRNSKFKLSEFGAPNAARRIWKNYLDSVLLDVLQKKVHPANEVFTSLFYKNETTQVLKFLDEDTSVAEDVAIMRTVPLAAFAKSAMRVALGKLK